MGVDRRVKGWNFVWAFVITSAIFFGGLFLGGKLASVQVDRVTQYQTDLATSLTSLELRHELLSKNICGLTNYNEFGEELGTLGRKLEGLEKGLRNNEAEILKLKEPYFLLEIRHFLLLQEAKDRCGSDIDLVLYFYSNNPKECEQCSDQGYILSYLQDKVGYEKMKIYSFDIRSKSPSVVTLMDLYKVKQSPLIVANGKSYQDFLDLDRLQDILGVSIDDADMPEL